MIKRQDNQRSIRFIYTYLLIHYYRDLIPALIDHGWHVEILVSRAEYRPGMTFELHPDVSVKYTPTLGLKTDGTLGKLMLATTYIFFGFFRTLFGAPVDTNVFFTQPPLFFSLWAYLLRKIRNQENYQILQDIFPDIAIETGHIRRGSLLAQVLMGISRFTLRRADHIGVIGRCMERKLLQEGFPEEKIDILPNWVNADLVKSIPHEENSFHIEHGWKDRFVLVYAGNIGIPQYFDDLLVVCERLHDKRPEFLLAFIGEGSRAAQVQAYQEQHGLDNIVFIPFQNIEKQSEFLSAGDVHFVSLRDGIEGLAVPSKTYSAMAAGRPIIYQGVPEGEIAQLISEYSFGVVVPLNNVDLLEQATLRYMDDAALRQAHGQKARQLAETICGYQVANQRIIALLEKA